MKVILRKDIETLGNIGDIVDVKEGYARNFLIPRKIAYIALNGNLKALEDEKKSIARKSEKELHAAEKISTDLEKVSVTIPVQVGAQMIADALKEKDFDIDKRKIEIEESIKTLGIYNVNIKLHSNINASIKVWVVRE
jgi:large subunit ribosomal protein L9